MTKTEFEAIAHDEGYGGPILVKFDPQSRSETHQHDKVSFVYVIEGVFILNTADGAQCYQSGETCLLGKDIDHAEEAGPAGATILVVRK